MPDLRRLEGYAIYQLRLLFNHQCCWMVDFFGLYVSMFNFGCLSLKIVIFVHLKPDSKPLKNIESLHNQVLECLIQAVDRFSPYMSVKLPVLMHFTHISVCDRSINAAYCHGSITQY